MHLRVIVTWLFGISRKLARRSGSLRIVLGGYPTSSPIDNESLPFAYLDLVPPEVRWWIALICTIFGVPCTVIGCYMMAPIWAVGLYSGGDLPREKHPGSASPLLAGAPSRAPSADPSSRPS